MASEELVPAITVGKISSKTSVIKDPENWRIKKSKQTDDVSIVSSRSCISISSNVSRALKMRIPKRNPNHKEAFRNRQDLTQIHFCPQQPIAVPLTQPTATSSSALQLTPMLPKSHRSALTNSDKLDTETTSVRRSKHKNKKSSNQKIQTIIEMIHSTEGYNCPNRKNSPIQSIVIKRSSTYKSEVFIATRSPTNAAVKKFK